MTPFKHSGRERRLRFATLVLLPLAYASFCLFQANHLYQPSIAETVPSMQVPGSPSLGHIQHARIAQDLVVTQPTPAPASAPATALKGRRTMVLLVNFRDSKRCGETLTSLFAHATQPELLRVSIHDQIDESLGDLPCVDAYCQLVGNHTCRRAQIVSTKVHAQDARGPTVARSITEQQLGDEEFCLGLDSHVVFVPEWDTKLVENWEATENPKAILTVYPKGIEFMDTDHSKDDKMGLMCTARIEQPDGDTMVQYQAVHWLDRTNATRPRLMSQFAGGFNFGSCQAYRDVPNDPFTPILFYGEEYVRAARLWTSGYDLYVPSVDVVFHWFETRKKIWDDDWSKRYQLMQRSKRRVRAMMGLPTTSDDYDRTEFVKFGLGTKRTFAQWQNFSGIDPLAKFTTDTRAQFENCGELAYVTYDA